MPAFFSKLVAVSAVAALFVAGAALASDEAIITKENAAFINSNAKTWVASEQQGLMTGATKKALQRLCGARMDGPQAPRKTYGKKVEDFPSSFDASEKWPNCPTITRIFDQAGCGSCWACSSTNSMSDRFCTYGVNSNVYLSPGNVMECDFWDSGCNGGQIGNALNYIGNSGVPTEDCQPYPFPNCAHHVVEPPLQPCVDHNTPNCPGGVCTGNGTSPYKLYYAANSWSLAGEADYMQELTTNGPFAVAFSVYADFPLYKGGVYQHTSGSFLGGHAVRLVGFGELNGVKYWKIANSWNKGWGLDGYFLIRRGVNECGIEASGGAAEPRK